MPFEYDKQFFSSTVAPAGTSGGGGTNEIKTEVVSTSGDIADQASEIVETSALTQAYSLISLTSNVDSNAIFYTAYDDTATVPDSNFVLLLNANGTNGDTTTTDATGNHTVTLNGAAQLSNTQVKYGTTSLKVGPTTSDYASIPESDDFQYDDYFCIEYFIYLNGAQANSDGIICSTDAAGTQGFGFVMEFAASNTIRAFSRPSGASSPTNFDVTSTTNLNDSAFHHVALESVNGVVTLYIDGTAEDTDTFSGTVEKQAGRPLEIGRRGTFGACDAWIDDLRIKNGGSVIYGANFTPPASELTNLGPIAYVGTTQALTGTTTTRMNGLFLVNEDEADSNVSIELQNLSGGLATVSLTIKYIALTS